MKRRKFLALSAVAAAMPVVAKLPAKSKLYGAVSEGSFTSVGIDDNATSEVLTLSTAYSDFEYRWIKEGWMPNVKANRWVPVNDVTVVSGFILCGRPKGYTKKG